MHFRRLLGLVLAFVAAGFLDPALARRTVIDASLVFSLFGYCSPGDAANFGCDSQSLPFALQIDGQTFNSFYINSNGTLSLQSIEPQLAAQNSFTGEFPNIVYTGPAPSESLSDYSVPIFSPNFVDGPGAFFSEEIFPDPPQYDGEFVATFSTTADSLYVEWFSCDFSPLLCGAKTIDALTPDQFSLDELYFHYGLQALGCPCDPYPGDDAVRAAGIETLLQLLDLPVYAMTLSQLGSGFAVDFTYNGDATGDIGTYGFNLPTGFFEATGPLTDRRFVFGADGQLVREVPEPSTWLMMLLGFGAIGGLVRRRHRRSQHTSVELIIH